MFRPSRNAVAGPDPDGRNIEPEVSSNLVKFGNSLEVDEFAVRLDQSKPTIPLQRAGIQHVRRLNRRTGKRLNGIHVDSGDGPGLKIC
jgi:hypothetical protein